MPASLHLIVPGLLGPLPTAADRWEALDPARPVLERLLARSRRQAHPFMDPYQLVASEFGLAAGDELPAAALGLLGEGLDPGEVAWLRADPVHLRADRDRLMLFPTETLSLQSEEAAALVAECNRFLAADELELTAPEPGRWYLRLPAAPALRTQPTASAAHRYVDDYLPSGDDARRWRALGTELEMLLHLSDVNQRRDARGQDTVNGLWLWGAGALPAPLQSRYRRVLSDDPVLRGLARHSGAEAAALGEGFVAPTDATLVFTLDLQQALRAGAFEDWLAALDALAERWLAPALEALARGELAELMVSTETAHLRLDRGALRRFWRRPRSLRKQLEWSDA